MAAESDPVEIVVCLGSSCFARGNMANLALLKKYAESAGSHVSVRLSGSLCQEQCKVGPNIMIDGTLHHGVTPAQLRELLQQLGKSGEAHGTA